MQGFWRIEFIRVSLAPLRPVPTTFELARPSLAWNAESLGFVLFVLSLAIYAYTRLYAIDQFPIYFFTDEAIHPALASDLVRTGLRDAQGRLLPPYFQNGLYWNLSLSVYLHLLPTVLFGKTIWVT